MPPSSSPSSSFLLSSLKDYSQCTLELTSAIRSTVLDPFEPPRSKHATTQPLSRAQQKTLAVKLAPLAMKIVNQNIGSLQDLKVPGKVDTSIYNTTVECLVDTTCIALAALRYMAAYTTLKPLDIEKLTSNLVCKLVDLKEYTRALDELCVLKAGLMKVTKLGVEDTKHDKMSKAKEMGSPRRRGFLTESPNRGNEAVHTPGGGSLSAPTSPLRTFETSMQYTLTQKEQLMLQKYGDLFTFPLDSSINDRSTILLILAYQMNALRCWTDIADGFFVWHLPQLLSQSGTFMDWCKHLMGFDKDMAARQFDAMYRQLTRAASKNSSLESTSSRTFALQAIAVKALKLAGTTSAKSLCHRMVQLGLTFEKSEEQVDYRRIQNTCADFINGIEPNCDDIPELDAYFTLSEYYAYASRKARSYSGEFYAYKFMMRPIRSLLSTTDQCKYYHGAYGATAKLALASTQLDKMTTSHSQIDMNMTLEEVDSCLQLVSAASEHNKTLDEYSEQAMCCMYKALDKFRQSCTRYFNHIEERSKKIQQYVTSRNSNAASPSVRQSLTNNLTEMREPVTALLSSLSNCKDVLLLILQVLKKKSWRGKAKQSPAPGDVMRNYIDIMVLLARMRFQLDDEDSYYASYEDLATAEQACEEFGYPAGYRWVSGAFYILGAAMANASMYASAIYPLRKACTLLEKSSSYAASETGRLHLAKRYEILGTCCRKDNRFEDAIKAYRSSLKKLPDSSIQSFVQEADKLAIHSLIERNPLIPKLIDRYLRAALFDGVSTELTFASDIMNLSTLVPEQRCIIYECELRTLYTCSFQMDCSHYQTALIEKLMKYYTPFLFPIRRARILLDQLRIELAKKNNGTITKTAMAFATEASKLLQQKESYGSDSDLLRYRQYYLALSQSWIGICAENDQDFSRAFAVAFRQWRTLFRKVMPVYQNTESNKLSSNDIKSIRANVDDLDKLYDHFRMLVDFFAVHRQRVYQINTLRLMLKLNNGLRRSADAISSSIIISTRIGHLYDEMGYPGKAALEFAQAKATIANMACSNEAEIYYILFYSLHLAKRGKLDDAKNLFNTSRIVWESIRRTQSKDKLERGRRKVSHKLMLADAHIVASTLCSMMQPTLDTAIQNCESALQVLSTCSRSLKLEKQDKDENTIMEDPFAESTTKQEDEIANMTTRIICDESEWSIAEKVALCLEQLSTLYMTRGSVRYTQYYMQKGLSLGEKLSSRLVQFRFLLHTSDFNLRYGRPETSKSYIKNAVEVQPEGRLHVYQDVLLKMAVGDVDGSEGCLEEALQAYSTAEELLKKITDRAYISSIEALIEMDETIDEHDESEPMMLENTLRDDDATPLHHLQGINTIRRALVLVQLGRMSKAMSLLDRLEELNILSSDKIDLNSAIAQLKLLFVRYEATQDQSSMFNRDVSLMPSFKAQQPRGSVKRSHVSHDMRTLRDGVTSALDRMMDIYQSGARKTRIKLVQEICLGIGYLMFMKNDFATLGKIMVHNYAAFGAYYLEMGKGVTLRREMRAELTSKVDFPGNTTDLGWPKRIICEGDDSMHNANNDDDPMDVDDDDESLQFRLRPTRRVVLREHGAEYFEQLRDMYDEEHVLDDAEFQEKFVDILPSHWTVCSITMDVDNDELYLVRLRRKEEPIVVKLSLTRMRDRLADQPVPGYRDAVETLESIIAASDQTIQDGKTCTRKQDVDAWWSKRTQLDLQLKKLLKTMEHGWFGAFKGFLSGQCQEHPKALQEFHGSVNQLVYNAVYQKPLDSQQVTRKHVDINKEICRLFLRLGSDPSSVEVEDALYFFLSCYEAHDIAVDHTQMNIGELSDHFRDLLQTYHMTAEAAGIHPMESVPNEHIILIPDKHTHLFPLESMDVLRSQSVSRVPCLSFVRDRIFQATAKQPEQNDWKDITVNGQSVYYLLNPAGDLLHTQREFESTFKKMEGWHGVVNQKPLELRWDQILQNHDIYMYFGHSAGQSIIRGSKIRHLRKGPVAILMGCSSGSLISQGEFDPDGYIMNFLLGGSPAVVANLWDVTDKSIDKLSRTMMENWGLLHKSSTHNSMTITEAVAKSRNSCRLPYLIGAAPIVYGIPVHVHR
ncbi:hypothetical protein O0I10_005700 [Lichtheimia ornata]|uniref:separase n=1 Tax=Lichtheimia ornata TaxID=688661 RepID=A0AAD7V4H5_9FUNG|nr:uncharacterized protein O0I10_005700 [Lichtheimia ornata]KAJ8658660.1 hypothetical protein O0I10_005700 [Lichtheimia ornata]